jgi:hypothetical protein
LDLFSIDLHQSSMVANEVKVVLCKARPVLRKRPLDSIETSSRFDQISSGRTIVSIDLILLSRRTCEGIVRSCEAIVLPIEVSFDPSETIVFSSVASPKFPIGSPKTIEREIDLHERIVRGARNSLGRTIDSYRGPIASTETWPALVRACERSSGLTELSSCLTEFDAEQLARELFPCAAGQASCLASTHS